MKNSEKVLTEFIRYSSRSRLAAVNAQASSIQCDVTALSSSDGSLYSTCCQSGSEDEADHQATAADDGTTYGHHLSSFPQPGKAVSWYGRTPTVNGSRMKRSSGPESADSVYNTLQAAVRQMNTPERDAIKEQQPAVMTPPALGKKPAVSSRQELRKRLQEVKLTSESGNASVIEVIEPSSSDDDDDGPMIGSRPPQDQSTPLRSSGNARSFNASFSEELEKARQSKNNNNNSRAGLLDSPAGSSKSADPLSKALLAEPDLLAGTIVTSSSTTGGSSRSCHDLALIEAEDDVNPSTRSHSSLSSSNNTAVTLVPRKKSGGFLTKFALKARWPSSKRKTPTDSLTAESSTCASDGGCDDLMSQNERDGSALDETSSVNASGVVAGLSQMFEDMSVLSIRSPSGGTALASEKRAPSSGRNSLVSNSVGGGEPPAQGAEEEGQMDLPPSTSPPPVPLELETYNSMSPSSSQQETSSSLSSASCSGASQPMPPPPPPRCGSGLNKTTTPSSSASSSTSASHGGVESLSVAASEDSGIVMARPASSASKSDSSPRAITTTASSAANSAAYSYATFSPLRCKAPEDRLSPTPPDVSKSEPMGDVAKTDSMRHFRQLARIEESAAASVTTVVPTEDQGVNKSATVPAGTDVGSGHQSGQILTWREAKLKNQVVTPPPLEERLNKVTSIFIFPFSSGSNCLIHPQARVRLEEKSIRTMKKRHHVSERPWYDVSDDESDLLTPERITKLKTSLSSSDTATSSSSDEDNERDVQV